MTAVAGTAQARLRKAEQQIHQVCEDAPSTLALVEGLRDPLDDALGLSGMFLGATDPDTTVFATAAVIEGLPDTMCAPWMHNEFLEDDFNKFADLHRTNAGVVTLYRAAQSRPNLSPRHATLHTPLGFGPELRTTFSYDNGCWGVANLLREANRPDFTEAELAWLDHLRTPIAKAFRRTLVTTAAPGDDDALPGVVTLDSDGQVLSMSENATVLLAELRGHGIDAGPQAKLPGEAYMVATVARARAIGRDRALRPVSRIQGRSGRWLTLRGDSTLSADGDLINIVLVVEPSRPTEIMPLVVAGYGLSAREQEVLTELAAGRPSGEIATRMFISEHTVRDHVKSILSRTGCSSRGELLSMLFHHHAYPVTTFTHV